MSIKLYNTMKREKEKLEPRVPGRISMYVCGPTTYNFIHLGNARPLVFFDTVRRYLEYRGFDVTYVQNFTDVDDKIINRAREEGMDVRALAELYIDEYFRDAASLGVRKADFHPRVSEHIEDIIKVISVLIEKGFAYTSCGDVYFDIRSFKSYGKLSGRTLDEMRAGARVQIDPRKKHPLDFVLWKASKEGEPRWDSPWGYGRPGWHIECSTMSIKYLGPNFDIHGGGMDLIFPHHENEIAQAEAFLGGTFARYWMHNGFITVNEEKMSKSLGNFFLVRDILRRYPPDLVRYYLLSTHYRSPLDFNDKKLKDSSKGLERLKKSYRLLQKTRERLKSNKGPYRNGQGLSEKLLNCVERTKKKFEEAMDDDFNTALAISSLFDFCRESNAEINRSEGFLSCEDIPALKEAEKLFKVIGEDVLGILKTEDAQGVIIEGEIAETTNVETLIQLAVEVREIFRKEKRYGSADRLRNLLKKYGVVLQDTPQGTRWESKTCIDTENFMEELISYFQKARRSREISETIWEKFNSAVKKMGNDLEENAVEQRES